MAKPRIFVSSTYYDLRHIRNSLESFIDGMGYESVLFESGDIPFHNDLTLADSCYSEVQNCHMLVLIVGGRYGSADVERKANASAEKIQKMYEIFNSVTQREYETARDRDIPIFIFLEKNVRAEYKTFEANRNNETIQYAHVDSVNIFKLLDEILSQKNNNFIREFEKFEDISTWLRDQWAGIFAELILKKKESREISSMAERILELGEITSSMKSYTETIMKRVAPDTAEEEIGKEDERNMKSRLKRFSEELLISSLVDSHELLSSVPVPSVERMYAVMSYSNSLAEFYAELNGDPVICQHMSDGEYENAYRILRMKYFGEGRSQRIGKHFPAPDRPL